jgi:PhnB protein
MQDWQEYQAMADDGAPVPERVTTRIAPWLSVSGASEALRFYQAAFSAIELYRLEGNDGRIAVARLAIEGADFWLQEDPDASSPATCSRSIRLLLTVEDPEAVFAQALAAGATQVFPVSEEHGWRMGRITDPFGHDWEICKPLG